MKLLVLLTLTILASSCNSQKEVRTNKSNDSMTKETASQIGNYVTSTFEDSNGNLWFGTLEKGIARYDGTQLKYFTKNDGLPSNRATSVIEDSNGTYWFATGAGLAKFDGEKFTNYQIKKDDWSSNMVSQLFIDSKGQFWIGTWNGVYKFDGKDFTPFPIPHPNVKTIINEDTKNWITEIEEDSEGNIWFGRNGYGACKYDGEAFIHFTKQDGLHSNNITKIEFDKKGNIWFGTRVAEHDNPDPTKRIGKGGVNEMVKNKIISFPEIDAFNNSDVYEIYEDTDENIWISTIKNGVFRFNGIEFKHYNVPISIMSMMNDQKGNLWLSGAGGLYRINKNDDLINITTNGPWN